MGLILGCIVVFWHALSGWLSVRQHFGAFWGVLVIPTQHLPLCRVWDALTDGFVPRGSPQPWMHPEAEAPDGTDPQVWL